MNLGALSLTSVSAMITSTSRCSAGLPPSVARITARMRELDSLSKWTALDSTPVTGSTFNELEEFGGGTTSEYVIRAFSSISKSVAVTCECL